MKVNTETETETERESETDFECPPLPAELQARVNQLLARREDLLNLGKDSDEVGELLFEAEKMRRTWRDSCENQWRRETSSHHDQGNARAPAPAMEPGARQPVPPVTSAAANSGHLTKLAEYLSLKQREKDSEVLAGSAFAFWRKHREQIEKDSKSPVAQPGVRVREPAATSAGSNAEKPAATKLAEYFSLKQREKDGAVPAGSAFAFWREHRKQIQDDRQSQLI